VLSESAGGRTLINFYNWGGPYLAFLVRKCPFIRRVSVLTVTKVAEIVKRRLTRVS
jgi:hypothetical protein